MAWILVAEVLAINIRNDNNIKGIKINDVELKLSLMADDTTLFLADIDSLTLSKHKFIEFEKCSGLKLNLNKTEIIPIGKSREKYITLPDELKTIQINHGPFKALGIWYSYDHEEILKLNVDKRLKSMNTISIFEDREIYH